MYMKIIYLFSEIRTDNKTDNIRLK